MKRFDLSFFSLVFANFIPIVGVVFYGWDIFPMVYIYFLETVVVGFYGLLKILIAEGHDHFYDKGFITNILLSQIMPDLGPASPKIAVIGTFFFTSLIFYAILFGLCLLAFSPRNLQTAWSPTYLIAVLGLFISHGISFFDNFIAKKEYRIAIPYLEMTEPFDRVFLMFIVFACGAFAIYKLDSSIILLIALIVLKIFFDLLSHWQEHKRLERELVNFAIG